LGLDDMAGVDGLGTLHAADGAAAGPAGLVGKPLTEVERYYIEEALKLTAGNREEAARMLGIGERTLYRVIQDWKLQDKIKQALAKTGGDIPAAAEILGMTASALERKIKKAGLTATNQDA